MRTKELTRGFTRRMLSGGAALLLGGLLIGGCSQDDDWTGGGTSDAVSFTAGIQVPGSPAAYNAGPRTRTTTGGDAWLTTDKVGIYMLTTSGSLTTAANVLADNRQYSATPGSPASSAAFTSTGTGETIYYPQTGNVDFISYYPYGTTGTGAGQITSGYLYNITVTGQTTADAQNALDVLYAKTTGVAKTKTAVNLAFGHVLSKVTLNVTLGEGLTSLSGSDITATSFSGMPQTATLDLQDGTLTAGGLGNFPALKAGTATSGYAATFTALLVPQPTANAYTGRTAVFTVNGEAYTWTIPNTETFEKGNHYTYPVTVKLTGVTVGTPTITDWTTNGNGAGIAKVKIPAGTFLMGSSDGTNSTGTPGVDPNATPAEPRVYDDERPQRDVSIGEFWMSKYQITNTQYAAFLNAIKADGDGKFSVLDYSDGKYPDTELVQDCSIKKRSAWGVKYDTDKWVPAIGYENHPVIYVTWYGADEFARWVGGSLPTEAQWEYACRAGTTTPFGIGDGTKLYADMANFKGTFPYELPYGQIDNYDGSGEHSNTYQAKPMPVGSYPYANAWGLYDMHGNVMEWTASYWTDSYSENDRQNPNTSKHVHRGGDWYYGANYCRSAFRDSAAPDYANYNVGFRVAFAGQ